jgi:iron complex outermembrane receptor protein
VDQQRQQAVIGASVYITELKKGASTRADGSYRITNLPKGTFTVEVRSLSYQSVIQRVTLNQNLQKDFTLTVSALQMNEVVVTGASATTLIKESPVPIATLSRLQWLQSSSTNLIDAVGKLPGMSQLSTGVGLSKPMIRGLGFNRVITMHDGIRQEDNQWGEEHAIQVDEYSVDRYEVIRGAGSLMYGSDGLGGVISLISAPQPEEGKVLGNVLTNYQSNNGLLGFSGMVTGNKNGLVWRLRGSHKNAGNYRNPYDGRVFGSNYNETNGSGMIGITRKWGYSHLYLSSFNQNINIIDGTRDSLGRFTRTVRVGDTTEALIPVSSQELNSRRMNQSSYQQLSNHKISLNNYFTLGSSSLSFNVGYSQNHRREYVNVFRPGVPTLYFFLQTLYYDVRYNLPAVNGWETTIGSNGMYQQMNNQGEESLYPNYNLLDNGAFVFTRKKLGRLNVSAGVRADRRALTIEKLYVDAEGKFQATPEGSVEERFKGFDNTFANVTGSLGAVYTLTEQLSVKANLARGFRVPSVSEISSNGEHAGTFRYEIGNPNQQSEVSFQSDLGFTLESNSLFVDLALFQNRIGHYSYSEKVLNSQGQDSIINPSVSTVPTFRYTQGNAQLWGGELTATLNPQSARWVSFTHSLSLVRAKNLSAKNDSAKYLPFMPAPRFTSTLKFTRQKWGNSLANLYFLIDFEYYWPQNQVLLAYNTERPTPDYGLLNLGLGADLMNASGNTLMSLYVTAQNVTNKAYQNHQNRLRYLDANQITGRSGVYNMGRNIGIKALIPLRFK